MKVERPIVTQPVNRAYEAGWVYTFKKCPVCKGPINVQFLDPDDDRFFDFECQDETCGCGGICDMRGINE